MTAAQSGWRTFLQFRREKLRSCVMRLRLLLNGVYIGEATRITGSGVLAFAPSSSVQRFGVLNARRGACIELGAGSRVGAFAVISAVSAIRIGSDVLIADRVFIADHQHGFDVLERPIIRQDATGIAPVEIGDGCWLGINVCIMPGVLLGRGCVVGAGSVVTRSFEAGSIIAGAPARLIRKRAGYE